MGNWLNKSGLIQIKNILSDKFATKVDNHPSNVAGGKFLQTNQNGYAVWGDAASPSAVAQAAEDWLDEHVVGEVTIATDKSLTISGYAADAASAGDIVMCTDTRPDPTDPTDHPTNRLWIDNTAQTEYEIPTMEDLNEITSVINSAPTEATAMEMLAEEELRTYHEKVLWDELDYLFTNLPSDETANGIYLELYKTNEYLEMLARECTERESA